MSSEIYGPATSEPPPAVAVIDAPVGRRLNNALTMKFLDNGGEEPFATALQSGGDGAGKKLGILFGFKNGSAGAHVVTYADGTTLTVPTVDGEPTLVNRGDGSAVASIVRGKTTTATGPDGQVVLAFLPDPVEPATSARDRLRITDAGGGYTTGDLVAAADFVLGGFQSQTGGALPMHRLGVRTILHRALTPVERDVVVAASVELGISIRPYVTGM